MQKLKVFTATIFSNEVQKVKVGYGKETVHSNSPHRLDGCILDDRVPLGWIVCCNLKGAVTIKFDRPSPPIAGEQIHVRVASDYSSGKWVIAPNVNGDEVIWREGWAYIPCHSQNHCEHIIDILKQGKIPRDIDPHIV